MFSSLKFLNTNQQIQQSSPKNVSTILSILSPFWGIPNHGLPPTCNTTPVGAKASKASRQSTPPVVDCNKVTCSVKSGKPSTPKIGASLGKLTAGIPKKIAGLELDVSSFDSGKD